MSLVPNAISNQTQAPLSRLRDVSDQIIIIDDEKDLPFPFKEMKLGLVLAFQEHVWRG